MVAAQVGRGSMSDAPESADGDGGAAEDLALSRRTLLGSITSVGILGSVSGYGTRMVLSDDTRLPTNDLESGRMNLGIAWTETYNGQQVETRGVCGSTDPDDYVDNTAAVITLDRAEPGDEGVVRICTLADGDSPSVWVRLSAGEFRENGRSQMEVDAGDDTPDEGELQRHLDLTAWIDDDCDGIRDDGEEVLASGTFVSAFDGPIGDGRLLAEDGTTPQCFSVRWTLPSDVPPTVLSDSVELSIEFAAQQTRHDGGATHPWGNR
jgi:hypothetical protein